MPRGENDEVAVAPVRASTRTVTKPLGVADPQREMRMLVERLYSRITRSLHGRAFDSQEAQMRAQAQALGVLSYSEQRELVRTVQTYVGPGRAIVCGRARDLLLLTNAGFIEDEIRRHAARGLEAEVLRQECREALAFAIDRFDFKFESSFLTYAANRMRGAVSGAIRNDSRLVRLKSRTSEIADRVQRTIKLLEAENKAPTLQAIADRLPDDSPQRIAEVLPWVTTSLVRLDAHVDSADGSSMSYSGAISDPNVHVEESTLDAIQSEDVRRAISELKSPLERRVIELYWNLDQDTVEVEQRDLFDGVYRDRRGRAYSAELSIIRDRAERGETVSKRSQVELNEGLRSGKLTFEPRTPEARELYELQQELAKMTGAPAVALTAATIQETLGRAYSKMAPHLSTLRDTLLYRGDNALENSEHAQALIRRELKRIVSDAGGAVEVPEIGRITPGAVDRLKPGRPSRSRVSSKAELRKAAEHFGLIDPSNGRIVHTALLERVGEPEAA